MRLGLHEWISVAAVTAVLAGGGLAPAASAGSAGSLNAGTLNVGLAAMVLEDFEEGFVTAGAIVLCEAPLDAINTGGCFPVGGVANGLRIEVPKTLEQEPLALLGDGFLDSPTTTLTTSNSDDVMVLRFTEPTNVVGFDLWSLAEPVAAECSVIVDYVDPEVPPSTTVAPCGPQTEPAAEFSFGPGPDIASLTIAATSSVIPGGNGHELLDNVSFGFQAPTSTPTPTPPTPTPTPPTPTPPTPTPTPTTPTPTPTTPATPAPTAAPPVTPVPAPVDLTAPNTNLKVKPTTPLRRVVKVVATADEAGSRFQCRLDGQKRFRSCEATQKLHVGVGSHTLRVRAVDRGGNIDRSPAKVSWVTK